MSRKKMMTQQRMRLILADEQTERLCFKEEPGSERTRCLDHHGLTCKAAKQWADLALFLVRDAARLLFVQGGQHGQPIKDTLWCQYDNRRLQSGRDDDCSPGLACCSVLAIPADRLCGDCSVTA